ncbi:MAG: histidine triad nucleotide-binding protein [Gammaproteobacteria bacterium]|nr:MAG: histidine triad nucleotide-binding protein [Gammaproteobacteria bacterium]
MTDCIFCKMVSGEIKADVVAETDEILAFRDINPQAPVHILIIPKKHIATTNDITEEDAELIGKMTLTAKQIAAEQNISENGYRLVLNCNQHGGQSVDHIHFHLLGGRQMMWPPG